MNPFGQELRTIREHRGISLESLSAETKVSPRFFEALEQGNFTVLPGGVFRRGIVRAYLASLSLAEDTWMPRFDSSLAEYARTHGLQQPTGDEAWATFAANVKRGRSASAPRSRTRWLGVLLLLLLVAAAGWYVWVYILRSRLAL